MNHNVIFENRYTVTEEMCKEFVYKVMSRRLYIYGAVLTVIFLLIAVFCHGNTTFVIVEAVCLAGMIATLILSPRRTLKQYLATGQTLSNGKRAETTVSFFETHLTVREGKNKVPIKYSQLQKVIRLNTVTMLMISDENGLMIKEDGFTVGNYEEFTKFIISRCPKIDRIQR